MKLILAILIVFSSITQYAPEVIAQTKKPATTRRQAQPTRKPRSRKKPVYVPPKPPRRLTPVSGRRRGMGSRNNCPAVPIPLTALAPFEQKQEVSRQLNKTSRSNTGVVGGLTTLEKPKFLFYVPYTKNFANLSAEFSLIDSKGEDFHRIKTELPAKPGIVSISLPETKSLKVGETYSWFYQVRCSKNSASIPVFVEGYIQRTNLNYSIAKQLSSTTDKQQKTIIYAEKGLWFDALNMLAQLRQSSNNTSLEADWQSLLNSVNLDKISTVPLVD